MSKYYTESETKTPTLHLDDGEVTTSLDFPAKCQEIIKQTRVN